MKQYFQNKRYYFNSLVATEATEFDTKHFNNLIAQHQYTQAYTYAKDYHFTDLNEEAKFRNRLFTLQNQGEISQAVYGRIYDKKTKDIIDFKDAVYKPEAFKTISDNYQTDVNGNKVVNPYIEGFKTLVKDLGSTKEAEATSLSLTFQPKKRTGIFGWDWIARDNHQTINDFYKSSGLNEEQLKMAGINPVTNDDGSVTINFDKTNELTHKILTNLPVDESWFAADTIGFVSYDKNGNKLMDHKLSSELENSLIQDYGVSQTGNYNDTSYVIRRMRAMVNDAEAISNEAFKERDLEPEVYSSTVFPVINDGINALNQEYAGKELDSNYYKQYKELGGHVYDFLYAGNHDVEMYTNWDNEDNEALRNADEYGLDKEEILRTFASAKPNEIEVYAMTSHGKLGTLYVLNPIADSKATNYKDRVKDEDEKRLHLFVPGINTEGIQEQLGNDTQYQAITEYNNMADWDYEKTLYNGNSITISDDGKSYLHTNDGIQEITKDEAIAELTKSIVQETGGNSLILNHLNEKGEFINENEYDDLAKRLAYANANDIYQDIPLVKADGVTPYTLDEIFAHAVEREYLADKNFTNSLNYQKAKKVKTIFDIFKAFMDTKDLYKN